MSNSTALAQRLALAVPALLLAGAYLSEYGFGLHPCEMCWWQRWPHFAAVGLALASFAIPPKRFWIAMAAGGIFTSGAIGVFHAGVEYGFWEGITACTAVEAEGVNALDAILNTPLIRCDVPQWTLAGISLAGFNAIISIGSAIAIWVLMSRKEAA